MTEYEILAQKLISSMEDRQRSLENRLETSFKEFKTELKAETGRVESAARDISQSVHGIDKTLAELRGEKLPERIDKLDGKIEKICEELDKRVSSLENWKSYILGALAILSATVTILVTILIKKLF